MKRITLKHLLWVLWSWLLLVEVLGEDGVTSKSEKRLVIKQESGPKGDSLVRSFVSTRVSRAFTSTSSFDDGRITDKPPDERQSTIRLSNDSVDLSKNTVPVVKYPLPTESTLKEKYRRTTVGPETTPLKKAFKLKRNMTRARPSDLTTLLVYNALTPGPGRYPSTTQVAESMPPTAWALASLKGPAPPPGVKPFVNWSTRLSRTTTPSPITTEVTGQVTEVKTTIQPDTTGFDITAPGNEETETSVIINETTSPIANVEVTTLPVTTEIMAEVTTLKPEENTISVPPLASLKNSSIGKEENDEFLSLTISESPKNVTPEPPVITNDSSIDNVHQNSVEAEETKNYTTSIPLTTMAITRLNESTTSGEIFKESSENSDITFEITDDSAKKSLQEADPSINTINEKKNDEQVSTSTVISTVNSTVTMHITPPSSKTTIKSNSTDFNDVDHKISDEEFAKNLPFTLETTTLSNSVFQSSLAPKAENLDSSINEANHTNDIKVTETNKRMVPIPLLGNVSSEIPSTIRSNEIKPEPISSNTIKTTNITDFRIESFPNYVQEHSETTQSNDIQVQDQIKPVNRTLVPQFTSENSSVLQKLPENKMITSSEPTYQTTHFPLINTTLPLTTINEDSPINYTIINNPAITVNETFATLPPVTSFEYTPSPDYNSTLVTINDKSTSILSSTTLIPTTVMNTTHEALSSTSLGNITTPANVAKVDTITTTSPSSTTKSNEIKEQELVTEIHQFPSESNGTNLDPDSKNSIKNDTFVFHEEDGDEDDTLSYNQTDIEKKGPHDTLSNNDNEDNGDDLLEPAVNASISVTVSNSSNQTTTSVPITRFSSVKTTTISDEVTIIDDDRANIDEDTIYDTGVIMTIYVRLVIRATYHDLCKNKDQLKDSIVKVFKKYAERTVNRRQVMITNLGINDCSEFRDEMESRLIPVHIMLTNSQGQYDKSLNDLFISLARRKNLDFKYPISQVEKVQQETLLETESEMSGTMVAVIIISSIAAVCLFALTILLVIMRKRQSGFNYGQRCTPVSLDDYSLDNISVYNSVRRKAIRASKRSYGNPAFDDPDAVSNPVNFAGLSNMASDKSKTDEEFSSLPQVVVKQDELPPGAEIKNRYANVIPIPETRVQLRASSPEDQFINANYVKGVKGADKFYIACQAPLQNTIEDFWKMIWDEQSRLIIMLTALTENGVEKCADYLPPSEVLDCHRVFGDLQVTLKKREAREKYVISSLQLKNLETNLWREVTHMWYAGWPPTGVPPEPSSVIAFLIEARSYSKSSPIVVHCSPGTGRTGTVIAIDIAIRDFEAGRSVDIPKTVVQVRRGRAGAVQTKDQYSFIYKVLHLYATKLTGGGLDSI
ncbi:uncharacterized protein [Halyomorpha halys]|uniref:uncharacterized protein n=1 Tax=Halyomorpha halys TaxID=286706 RepID=UPI0006D4FAB0|nr:mucin-12 [Halyomorpha halys]XP_014293840.1 mucin-12 [Halyomorpha halys]XP_014293841.1 mucin-12 [Halyomorpha halys]XP_014293842.1 mucin-12 [Halyomorpha halys]